MSGQVRLLYITYLAFFLGVFAVKLIGGIMPVYMANILLIALFSLSIFSSKNILVEKSTSYSVIFLLLLAVFLSFALVYDKQVYSLLLYTKITLLFIFFRVYPVSHSDLMLFLNRTYILYVIVSAVFFYFLPGSLFALKLTENNYVNLFFVRFLMFHTVEGSASSIDAYSGVILLVNLLLVPKGFSGRKFTIFLSVLMIILSLRLTPLVAVLVAIVVKMVVHNRFSAIASLLVGLSLFMGLLFLIKLNPTVYGFKLSLLLQLATHNRSMIWDQQLTVMHENYEFFDYIFGNFSSELFSIQAVRLDGILSSEEIDNPHNNFLVLFFRSPLIFIIYLSVFFRFIFTKFSKPWFIICAFIFTACFSNSGLIDLKNPIYIILFTYYFATHTDPLKSEKEYSQNTLRTSGL